jgi:hypothetical protein
MDRVSDAGPATDPQATLASADPKAADPRPARRRDQTGRDMALSVAVLLIPILLIGGLLRACGSSDPTVIDPGQAIANARAANLFPVVVPEGLGEGWQPVQATFRRTDGGARGTLRLGYLTPSGGQALFVVSNEDTGALLGRELGDDVRPQGEVSVNGRSWTSSVVRGDERALVRTETVRAQGEQTVRTIIVVGNATIEDLTALAGSLA